MDKVNCFSIVLFDLIIFWSCVLMNVNLVFVDLCDYCFSFEGFIVFNVFCFLGVVFFVMDLFWDINVF